MEISVATPTENYTPRSIVIRVIGSGGAGNNTIDTLQQVGLRGAELIAANTDAQDLLDTNADKKILLGKVLTRGMGAGNNPEMGEKAAAESAESIRKAIDGADMIFVVGGLGGGTGTGSIPLIAAEAKQKGCLTVALVTLPFKMEGQRRWDNAMHGLRKLEQHVDTLVVIPNERLMEHAQDLSMIDAFRVADMVCASALKGLIELIMMPGLVNLDFADVRTVLRDSGVGVIGMGESDTQSRHLEAVGTAMHNPLIEANVRGASGALLNLVGGKDLTLSQAKAAVDIVRESIAEDAKLIWGIQIDEKMSGKVRAMVIITGLSSKAILDSRAEDGFVHVDDFV